VNVAVPPERVQRRAALGRRWLLLPVLAYLTLFYILPVARLLALSVWADGPDVRPFTEIVQHPEYLIVLWTTLQIAVGVTVVALLLGYPVAYYLTRLEGRGLAIAMFFVLLPFWTSVLVRTFAWIALLGRVGVINQVLLRLNVIETPLALIFNRTGVYIGLVHVLMPFAILPVYSVMRGIDGRLVLAAESLGASPPQAFWRVFFPLSLPGVTSGGLLVFIAAAGAYITPALLGGLQDIMIAQLIGDQIDKTLNWPLGAALSVLLLTATVLMFVIYFRLVGGDKMWADRA
jgi:ABC-type spermidine/putrescine transport system permease subunit I